MRSASANKLSYDMHVQYKAIYNRMQQDQEATAWYM